MHHHLTFLHQRHFLTCRFIPFTYLLLPAGAAGQQAFVPSMQQGDQSSNSCQRGAGGCASLLQLARRLQDSQVHAS